MCSTELVSASFIRPGQIALEEDKQLKNIRVRLIDVFCNLDLIADPKLQIRFPLRPLRQIS
jgi:hypothetical protein